MPVIAIGELDRRILFQRVTNTPNALNEPVEAWSDIATVWARRRDVSDGEKEASAQVGATLISRFVIRSTSTSRDFQETDRIIHDGAAWNILGIKEADAGRLCFLEITAIMDRDNG